jgi:hypothetical protein
LDLSGKVAQKLIRLNLHPFSFLRSTQHAVEDNLSTRFVSPTKVDSAFEKKQVDRHD